MKQSTRHRIASGVTAIAIVFDRNGLGASTASAATWSGGLGELGAAIVADGGVTSDPVGADDRPGILVIGQVVSLAATLSQQLPVLSLAQARSRS